MSADTVREGTVEAALREVDHLGMLFAAWCPHGMDSSRASEYGWAADFRASLDRIKEHVAALRSRGSTDTRLTEALVVERFEQEKAAHDDLATAAIQSKHPGRWLWNSHHFDLDVKRDDCPLCAALQRPFSAHDDLVAAAMVSWNEHLDSLAAARADAGEPT